MVIRTQHERKVRALVEDKYGPLVDESWDEWCALAFPDFPDDFSELPEMDAGQIVERIEALRRVGLPRPKREAAERPDKDVVVNTQPEW